MLLWEMVSVGVIPLPGLTAQDIAEFAVTKKLQHVMYVIIIDIISTNNIVNFSLCSPPECPPVLSSLISQCHNHDPDKRPSFTDILSQLSVSTVHAT